MRKDLLAQSYGLEDRVVVEIQNNRDSSCLYPNQQAINEHAARYSDNQERI
jgi:hypothetical protein